MYLVLNNVLIFAHITIINGCDMLLEFTVENFRSFNQRKTLSLEAVNAQKDYANALFTENKYTLLRALAIYGANSSGKSNLVYALNAMQSCVLNSVRLNAYDPLDYDPFLLIKDDERPTMFEIKFLRDGYLYRYGFRYDRERIASEWLFRKTTPGSKEQYLFLRDEEGIDVNKATFPEGSGCEERTNGNRLFLSLCHQLGGEISRRVMAWFLSDFKVISGLNNQIYRNDSKSFFHEKKASSTEALEFFQKLKLGFNGIITREIAPTIPQNVPDEMREMMMKRFRKDIKLDSVHNCYSKDGSVAGTVNFSFDERESSGTNKLFDLSGPIFEALSGGKILIIDELDAKMHPLISQYIIRLFNNPESNPNNAQLIFTTHDTHLLSLKMLRRDQIWFTEKDAMEQTDLYSLSDFVLPDGTRPRNDANYEKNYIAGRYGAIPFIVNE